MLVRRARTATTDGSSGTPVYRPTSTLSRDVRASSSNRATAARWTRDVGPVEAPIPTPLLVCHLRSRVVAARPSRRGATGRGVEVIVLRGEDNVVCPSWLHCCLPRARSEGCDNSAQSHCQRPIRATPGAQRMSPVGPAHAFPRAPRSSRLSSSEGITSAQNSLADALPLTGWVGIGPGAHACTNGCHRVAAARLYHATSDSDSPVRRLDHFAALVCVRTTRRGCPTANLWGSSMQAPLRVRSSTAVFRTRRSTRLRLLPWRTPHASSLGARPSGPTGCRGGWMELVACLLCLFIARGPGQ